MAEPSLESEERLHQVEQLVLYLLLNLKSDDRLINEYRNQMVHRFELNRESGFIDRESWPIRFDVSNLRRILQLDRMENQISKLSQGFIDLDERTQSVAANTQFSLERIRSEIERVRGENLELLVLLSESRALAKERFRRIVPLSIYIAENNPEAGEALTSSFKAIGECLGFDTYSETAPIRNSWLKRVFLRTKAELTRPEVQDRFEKVERSFELKHVDVPQSKVDVDLSKAALNARKTLDGIPEGTRST
jgi:hypothetical protein